LQKFVDKYKTDKNVIGIFLTGSYLHSIPDKNSDLDVYILIKKSDFRERGNTWINGIEIEYFTNSVKQVKHYFKEEKDGEICTAHMFVNSKILYSKGNELQKLMQKAIKIIKTQRKPIEKDSKEISKYHIDDLEKDLEDVYLKKDCFSFNLIAIEILNEALNTFLKIKRLNVEKPKRLFNYIHQNDSRFAELYKKALLETKIPKRYLDLRNLIRYIENKLGGKRSKEWRLRGKCTYIKK
jgi:hypothetical protein